MTPPFLPYTPDQDTERGRPGRRGTAGLYAVPDPPPLRLDTHDVWDDDETLVEMRGPALRDPSGPIPQPQRRGWMDGRLLEPPRLWLLLLATVLTVLLVPAVIDHRAQGEAADLTPQSTSAGGSGKVPAVDLLRFGGNAQGATFADGTNPASVSTVHRYPARAMCVDANDGADGTKQCGLGAGSQVLLAKVGGVRTLVVGALDGTVRFLDPLSGADRLRPLRLNSAVTGTVAMDPDGYPLMYVGTHDGRLRVVGLENGAARELWQFDLSTQDDGVWRAGWSAAPLVIDDNLIAGGDNGRLYVFRLNRRRTPTGSVAVEPVGMRSIPTWNDQFLASLHDREVGVTSLVQAGERVYVANAGGRVLGFATAALTGTGDANPQFQWTAPDAILAPMSVDGGGRLYVPVALKRRTASSDDHTVAVALNPLASSPVMWRQGTAGDEPSGSVSAVTFGAGVAVVSTDSGVLTGVNLLTGAPGWQVRVGGPFRSTPVVSGSSLVVADCDGRVRSWDVTANPPKPQWTARISGCVESTPVVAGESVYVGGRSGFIYRLAAN